MSIEPMHASILHSLTQRPSRSSAAAIGVKFVLNGQPAALRMRGIDALAHMVCDWSAAIFDEAIHDPSRGYLVRRHALKRLTELLSDAVQRGYHGLDARKLESLEERAREWLLCSRSGIDREGVATTELCNHLSQAVEQGFFGSLQDF